MAHPGCPCTTGWGHANSDGMTRSQDTARAPNMGGDPGHRKNPIRGRRPLPWVGIPARRRAPQGTSLRGRRAEPAGSPADTISASRGHKCVFGHFPPLNQSLLGTDEKSFASLSRTPLSGGQSPGGASPLPDPGRPPSRLRMAAAHLPARGD